MTISSSERDRAAQTLIDDPVAIDRMVARLLGEASLETGEIAASTPEACRLMLIGVLQGVQDCIEKTPDGTPIAENQ